MAKNDFQYGGWNSYRPDAVLLRYNEAETIFKAHSGSLAMAQFNGPRVTFYRWSVLCTICIFFINSKR